MCNKDDSLSTVTCLSVDTQTANTQQIARIITQIRSDFRWHTPPGCTNHKHTTAYMRKHSNTMRPLVTYRYLPQPGCTNRKNTTAYTCKYSNTMRLLIPASAWMLPKTLIILLAVSPSHRAPERQHSVANCCIVIVCLCMYFDMPACCWLSCSMLWICVCMYAVSMHTYIHNTYTSNC